MENKSMSVKKTDSILAYYEKPHSKRILKNFYKNFFGRYAQLYLRAYRFPYLSTFNFQLSKSP